MVQGSGPLGIAIVSTKMDAAQAPVEFKKMIGRELIHGNRKWFCSDWQVCRDPR
jgi:hypothetical protein